MAKKVVKPKKLKQVIKLGKPIGKVTHYFGGIKVAIIKFRVTVKIGTTVLIKGATTDFKQKITSMQYDHKEISAAKPKKEVGIKVTKRVREGDGVYSAEGGSSKGGKA